MTGRVLADPTLKIFMGFCDFSIANTYQLTKEKLPAPPPPKKF